MVYNYFSGLFSTSTSTQNSLTSLYNNLGDYSTIQSGSYKKLLSSYYKTTDDSSSDTSNKVSSLLQTTNKSTNNKELTNLKSASGDLSEAGQKLLQKGSNTVFSEDNVDDMVSAVKTFATAYNKTITRAEDIADVNVTEKVLSDLKVTIQTKTTYEIGETFDVTGMGVTAYYNNGQQYSVDNYVMSEFDSNSAGAKEIKITYEGMTRSFVVTVVEKTPIATGGKIEVGTGKGRLGETISVPVTITKNTGLSAFCHTITFDANDLAFKKVNLQGGFANGTVIINDEKVANGEITVLWFQANNVMESGVAYTLEFEVLETATDGISDITIAFDANENGNASGENVLFEAVNGSVEVLSYWLGDLNGDRKYAMADLLQLAQYVSGQTMTLNDKQKLSADVNEDGIIDIHDVTLLSQWLLEADM